MTDSQLDSALATEIASSRREFQLVGIGLASYTRIDFNSPASGHLARLERAALYCQRLLSLYQIADWCQQNKRLL